MAGTSAIRCMLAQIMVKCLRPRRLVHPKKQLVLNCVSYRARKKSDCKHQPLASSISRNSYEDTFLWMNFRHPQAKLFQIIFHQHILVFAVFKSLWHFLVLKLDLLLVNQVSCNIYALTGLQRNKFSITIFHVRLAPCSKSALL